MDNTFTSNMKDIKEMLEKLNKNIETQNKLAFINLLNTKDPIRIRLLTQLRNELF
jgi:hypothetical protein